MKASIKPILNVLGMPNACFLVPVFQRVYAWTELQCEQLFADVIRSARDNESHFMGTLIYLPEKGSGTDDGIVPISVIDGQQRLTTLMLLLIALRNHLCAIGGEEDAWAEHINRKYLRLPNGMVKLVLSEADASTLSALVTELSDVAMFGEPSKYIMDNFKCFTEYFNGEAFDVELLMSGLKNLNVVAVELDNNDSPQQVFESLNAKGRPLTTTDLLRYTLVMTYGFEKQERLFGLYWEPIEDAFRKFAPDQDLYIDAALHQWITGVAPQIRAERRNDLYAALKDYLDSARKCGARLEDMLKSLNETCLAFAAAPDSPEAKEHLDWVTDKPKGLISQRKIFGD